jgi:hypothetical protein
VVDESNLLEWLESSALNCLEREGAAVDAEDGLGAAYWFGRRTALNEVAVRVERGLFNG